jgi:hypothetical protein
MTGGSSPSFRGIVDRRAAMMPEPRGRRKPGLGGGAPSSSRQGRKSSRARRVWRHASGSERAPRQEAFVPGGRQKAFAPAAGDAMIDPVESGG